jgi:diphthamide synthase subunit DPH2
VSAHFTCPLCYADLPNLDDVYPFDQVDDFVCPGCGKRLTIDWDDMPTEDGDDIPVIRISEAK